MPYGMVLVQGLLPLHRLSHPGGDPLPETADAPHTSAAAATPGSGRILAPTAPRGTPARVVALPSQDNQEDVS